MGVQSEHVKLYDLRGFDKGPFVTFKLPQEKQCEWTGKITVKHNKINETFKEPKKYSCILKKYCESFYRFKV